MSEWSNEIAWKVIVLARVPGVRIPLSPPDKFHFINPYYKFSIVRFLLLYILGKQHIIQKDILVLVKN